MATTTDTAHSAPPEVAVEGRGLHGDIPVITLDLEAGAIARSIIRRIGAAMLRHRASFLFTTIGAETPSGREPYIDNVLGFCRPQGAFQVDLSHEAAEDLHRQLTDALRVAETECRQGGCYAVGTHDGLCPHHAERADMRVMTGGAA